MTSTLTHETFYQIPANGDWLSRTSNDNVNSRPNSRWLGTCVHDVQVPKWVQKRKQVYLGEGEDVRVDDYEQPRRAVKVAVNMRFSLIAIGTRWYVDLGAELSFTGLMTSMHLVVTWNTRASLRSVVSRQNLKCWRPFNLITSKKEGRSVPWNGARMGTSLRSVGRRVGLFGVWLVGA
jgi:hypothetical protein